MKKILFILFLVLSNASSIFAISKEEFVKLPYIKRQKFAVVVGVSSEYAIPIEEALKLSFEVRSAIVLEKGRQRVQYAMENIGKKRKEIDISRLYDLGMVNAEIYPDALINYLTICGFYVGACENHFKAAEYCYKDYLEWKKSELGQPSLWQPGGGDEQPLSWILKFYSDYRMYEEWDKLYTDYYSFHWLRPAKGKTIKEKKESLKNNEGYLNFMHEWKGIKKLAKTTQPKSLSIQVQVYEWFYSDKQEEVLKALEYYHTNKVKFMLEKALKHKAPVIAAKAKEYIDSLAKGAGDETKH